MIVHIHIAWLILAAVLLWALWWFNPANIMNR